MAQASAHAPGTGCTIASDENGLEEEILRVWQNTKPALTTLLTKLTNHQEAADLLQETFLRIYQARSKIKGQIPAKYIVKVAANTATDHNRHYQITQAATAAYLEMLQTFNHASQTRRTAEYRVLLREIDEAASRLSAKDQELLRLYTNGNSITEDAKKLDIPTTTLASRYYAAIKRLRRQLTRR